MTEIARVRWLVHELMVGVDTVDETTITEDQLRQLMVRAQCVCAGLEGFSIRRQMGRNLPGGTLNENRRIGIQS